MKHGLSSRKGGKKEKQLGESSHSFDTATLNSVSLEEDFESDATRSSQSDSEKEVNSFIYDQSTPKVIKDGNLYHCKIQTTAFQ